MVYGQRKSKRRLKSELLRVPNDCSQKVAQYIAVCVLWQMQKLCYRACFSLLYLNLRAISEYKPPGTQIYD